MSKVSDKFEIPELPVNTPICHTCRYWYQDLTCKAFPDGIPFGILTNEWDHRFPVDGDHGLVYEPKDSKDEVEKASNLDAYNATFSRRQKPAEGAVPLAQVKSEITELNAQQAGTWKVPAKVWNNAYPNVSPKEFLRGMTGREDAPVEVLLRDRVGSTAPVIIEIANTKRFDLYGARVESYSRVLLPADHTVKHELLTLEPGTQDSGATKQFFRNALPLYEKMGVKTIKAYANLEAGGYAWARYGFESETPPAQTIGESLKYSDALVKGSSSILSTAAMAEYFSYKLSAQAIIKKNAPQNMQQFTDLKTPILDQELHAVLQAEVPALKTPTVTKVGMQNVSWEGKLDLTNPVQRARLDRYVGSSS